MTVRFDAVVIGEGIAGLTVAGLLAEKGARVASFESTMFGGLILNLTHLQPVPMDAPASGPDFASSLLARNMDIGVSRFEEEVTSLAEGGIGYVISTGNSTIEGRHVIVASGARFKDLGVPGETNFEGRGISHCADCDGRLFSGEDVAVVGGGDSALQEALVLSEFCQTVHLLVRKARFKAREQFVDALKAKSNIKVAFDTQVVAIEGDDKVKAVLVQTKQGETFNIPCSGFFPFVGLLANTRFLPPTINLDVDGRVKTDSSCATNLPGIWAIGAVRAAGDGLLSGAVMDAQTVAEAISANADFGHEGS